MQETQVSRANPRWSQANRGLTSFVDNLTQMPVAAQRTGFASSRGSSSNRQLSQRTRSSKLPPISSHNGLATVLSTAAQPASPMTASPDENAPRQHRHTSDPYEPHRILAIDAVPQRQASLEVAPGDRGVGKWGSGNTRSVKSCARLLHGRCKGTISEQRMRFHGKCCQPGVRFEHAQYTSIAV